MFLKQRTVRYVRAREYLSAFHERKREAWKVALHVVMYQQRESDGFCNGIDMFLQILASGLWFSGVCNNGLTAMVGEECREQGMALSFVKGEIRI